VIKNPATWFGSVGLTLLTELRHHNPHLFDGLFERRPHSTMARR